MFNYINSSDIYSETFFKFPKALIYNSRYRNLSNDAKIAYIILKDRLEYSIQNNWIDENNRVYFICTNDELQDILNCSRPTVIKLKKELENIMLLKQQRQGLNKPNMMYLANLELAGHEVYLKSVQSNNLGSKESLHPKKIQEPSDTKGNKNSLLPKKGRETLATEGSKKFLHNLEKDLKPDTNITDTLKNDTERQLLQEKELLSTFHLTNDQTFLAERTLEFIALYAKTYQQAYDTVGVIQRAKKKAERESGVLLIAEDWQVEMDLHVRKVVQKIRTDHKIRHTENYMFTSFCNFFLECCHYSKVTEPVTPKVSVTLHNWLE